MPLVANQKGRSRKNPKRPRTFHQDSDVCTRRTGNLIERDSPLRVGEAPVIDPNRVVECGSVEGADEVDRKVLFGISQEGHSYESRSVAPPLSMEQGIGVHHSSGKHSNGIHTPISREENEYTAGSLSESDPLTGSREGKSISFSGEFDSGKGISSPVSGPNPDQKDLSGLGHENLGQSPVVQLSLPGGEGEEREARTEEEIRRKEQRNQDEAKEKEKDSENPKLGSRVLVLGRGMCKSKRTPKRYEFVSRGKMMRICGIEEGSFPDFKECMSFLIHAADTAVEYQLNNFLTPRYGYLAKYIIIVPCTESNKCVLYTSYNIFNLIVALSTKLSLGRPYKMLPLIYCLKEHHTSDISFWTQDVDHIIVYEILNRVSLFFIKNSKSIAKIIEEQPCRVARLFSNLCRSIIETSNPKDWEKMADLLDSKKTTKSRSIPISDLSLLHPICVFVNYMCSGFKSPKKLKAYDDFARNVCIHLENQDGAILLYGATMELAQGLSKSKKFKGQGGFLTAQERYVVFAEYCLQVIRPEGFETFSHEKRLSLLQGIRKHGHSKFFFLRNQSPTNKEFNVAEEIRKDFSKFRDIGLKEKMTMGKKTKWLIDFDAIIGVLYNLEILSSKKLRSDGYRFVSRDDVLGVALHDNTIAIKLQKRKGKMIYNDQHILI